MAEQISIFSVLSQEDYSIEYEKLRLEALKAKRIRYKNPSYVKHYEEDVHQDGFQTKDYELWGNMNRLYVELSNRFPFPTAFEQDKEIIQKDNDTFYVDMGKIRTYKVCYHREKYKHKGDDGIIKEYEGEEFFYNFAEVIGTEDFGINERLFIHSELMYYLDEGYRLKDLTMWLDELVNWFSNGWNAELLLIMFITRGFKNEYE